MQVSSSKQRGSFQGLGVLILELVRIAFHLVSFGSQCFEHREIEPAVSLEFLGVTWTSRWQSCFAHDEHLH